MQMPFHVMGIFLRAGLALAYPIAAGGLLWNWNAHRREVVIVERPVDTNGGAARGPAVAPLERTTVVREWRFGANWRTAELLAGLGLALWTLGGGLVGFPRLLRKSGDPPPDDRATETRRIPRPDGSELHVEIYGPAGAPTVVLTHGWGANAREWAYLRRELGDRYRLVAWDLPGLGRSKGPRNRDYSVDKMAADLEAVIDESGGGPVLLLGHSIGGMILLRYCALFPQRLGTRVAGLTLVQTTYTNPVRTTKNAGILTAIERPVIVPLCRLLIVVSPLVRLLTWMGYANGSLHRSSERSGFSGNETVEQLDFVARFQVEAVPAVVARGMLGMMRYDATDVLPRIPVPTLVVLGDRDPVTLPEASARMIAEIPLAEASTLVPAKHMGLIEHHPRFAAVVDEFASRVLPVHQHV